jgi:hypothetical protein
MTFTHYFPTLLSICGWVDTIEENGSANHVASGWLTVVASETFHDPGLETRELNYTFDIRVQFPSYAAVSSQLIANIALTYSIVAQSYSARNARAIVTFRTTLTHPLYLQLSDQLAPIQISGTAKPGFVATLSATKETDVWDVGIYPSPGVARQSVFLVLFLLFLLLLLLLLLLLSFLFLCFLV